MTGGLAMKQKCKTSSSQVIARGEAVLLRRAEARRSREQAAGTVFFSGPIETSLTELKLKGEQLTFLRSQSGENSGIQGYLLRRLDCSTWEADRLKLRGEFFYEAADSLTQVHPRDARIVRATLSARRPLENEDALRNFLERAAQRAETGRQEPSEEPVYKEADRTEQIILQMAELAEISARDILSVLDITQDEAETQLAYLVEQGKLTETQTEGIPRYKKAG